MLQSLNHLTGPMLDSVPQVHILYWLAQHWTQHSRYVSEILSRWEGSPLNLWAALPHSVQNAAGLFCNTGTSLLWSACCPLGNEGASLLSSCLVPTVPGARGIPSQVQACVFPLAQLHEIPLSPVLQAVEVHLNGSMTLRCIQFWMICELAKDALCPIH